MNTATIKDNHLYINYEIYDYGYRTKQKIIPLEDIECIKAKVGVRGGKRRKTLLLCQELPPMPTNI